MILAQRYPKLYQGIISTAPSFNWVTFLVTEFYPHVVMKRLNYYPAPCELDAITAAAIDACDEIDGVKDGIISAPGQCKFDPKSVVGQKYTCGTDTRKITKQAADRLPRQNGSSPFGIINHTRGHNDVFWTLKQRWPSDCPARPRICSILSQARAASSSWVETI